jgi:hypothetical protein
MKRFPAFFIFIFILISAVYGQNTANSLQYLDSVVKGAAADIHKGLAAEGSPKVAVGQFIYRDAVPSLGSYWNTQLVQELMNIPNRSWILLTGSLADADWIISGEIVDINNNVRVYTRLIRSRDRSIAAGVQSDFIRDEFLTQMLSGGGSSSGGRSSSIPQDAYEPDSRDNPLTVELGVDESAAVINRTLHSSNDEDFFLLAPDRDGALIMETTGSTDTIMELYEAGSGNKLSENDDGGSGGNARIRQTVRAGSRYIAKVSGFDGETGSYGFRAYILEEVRVAPDEYEPDNDFLSAREIIIGTPQQHTFTNGDDVDWVKFQVTRAGSYTIRARGLSSGRLDTYIELFDSNQHAIDEDDDGGENLDSRLAVRLKTGTYYLKVECLDSNPSQPYTISVDAE